MNVAPPSFWTDGPAPGQYYHFPGPAFSATSAASGMDGRQRTQHPSTQGTSVLGVKFDGGVIIAADRLGSYGSLARFRGISRVMKVNERTVMGAGGDYADYQFLQDVIEQRVIEEECLDDGISYTPKALHSWLTRVMYNRRSKFNPLWNSVVIGGIENDGSSYLGTVSMIGIAFNDAAIATGFGGHLALPMMRDALEKKPNLNVTEAKELIAKCMEVLFYRDARSMDEYEMAVITPAGTEVISPIPVKSNWDVGLLVMGHE